MGRYDPESYDMLRAFHLCTRCGDKTSQKPDGDYYSLCDSCRERAQQKKGERVENSTICWHCIHAVPDPIKGYGCSWSRCFKPVEGWTADETIMKQAGGKTTKSYCVRACPQFKSDRSNVKSKCKKSRRG